MAGRWPRSDLHGRGRGASRIHPMQLRHPRLMTCIETVYRREMEAPIEDMKRFLDGLSTYLSTKGVPGSMIVDLL
ncbi:MAG: hypothetical protein ACLRSD_18070 [Oscillibacter sp.]